MVAEERGLGNASGVHGVEGDVLGLAEAAVHLEDCEHVAGLSVLISLEVRMSFAVCVRWWPMS